MRTGWGLRNFRPAFFPLAPTASETIIPVPLAGKSGLPTIGNQSLVTIALLTGTIV
jgi:hypothetical protein